MQSLKELIYSVSAANIFDITIIGCLIYFVLAWLKGTRAFQILATLLGIGLFYLAASASGLILTSVLFQYLWAAIIVVLVIVFQPEIREMLDRASPIRYLSGRQPNDIKPDIIDEILRAVAELARLKVGALIVFQRFDRVDNLILKGTVLDSLISADALVMIFQKTSPLHDGAVLIFQDRIKSASCVLPLSQNEDLSSNYCVARIALVYGCSANKSKCFTETILEKVGRGENVRLFVDEYRTPVYSKNLCHALLELAGREDLQGIYHLAGPERLSRFEFGLSLAAIFGFDTNFLVPVSVNDGAFAYDRPRDCSLNRDKATKVLSTRFWGIEESLNDMKDAWAHQPSDLS